MKLTGTKTENDFRQELESSWQWLCADPLGAPVLLELRKIEPELFVAYMLKWVPDQDQVFFQFLVDDLKIVSLLFDSYTSERADERTILIVAYGNLIEFESVALNEYRKGLKKQATIQLAVALDLANNAVRN